MIKASLGLSFMIQLKTKIPDNIFLIPCLAFTPFVTSFNVLPTSLNLINKNLMSSKFYYNFELMIKILIS